MNNKLLIKVILLSVLHLAVDGICAYVIMQDAYCKQSNEIIILVFILYNGLAFLTQPFVGMFLDKKHLEKTSLLLSYIFIILGAIIPFHFIIRITLLGLGNSIFHVVGGKYTVKLTNKKLTFLGLFVAFGATGLAVGTYAKYGESIVLDIFLTLVIVLGSITLLLKTEEKEEYKKESEALSKEDIINISLIAVVVLIRAIMGKVCLPKFNTTITILIVISICISLGKVIGGILSDLIGIRLTTIITLSLSLIGYFFFRDNLYIYLIATILFNTTMPITLFLANTTLKKREGLSFGILAFMLFPGFLIGELFNKINISFVPILVISVVLSMAIILNIYKKYKNKGLIK